MTLRLVPGLYETLVTRELQEAIAKLGDGVADLQPADAGDAHRAVAEHVRRLVERALRSLPEATRLAAQAQLCNELLAQSLPPVPIEASRSTFAPSPNDCQVASFACDRALYCRVEHSRQDSSENIAGLTRLQDMLFDRVLALAASNEESDGSQATSLE